MCAIMHVIHATEIFMALIKRVTKTAQWHKRNQIRTEFDRKLFRCVSTASEIGIKDFKHRIQSCIMDFFTLIGVGRLY